MDFSASAAPSYSCSSSSTISISHAGSLISASGVTDLSRSRDTWNSVPFPDSLLTTIVPPMASTIYLVIAIPRPVPSVFCTRVLSSLENDSKSFFWNSFDIPMPLSLTRRWTLTYASPRGDSSSHKNRRIVPSSGVNFTALPRKLIRT